MYKINKIIPTSINVNNGMEGESIEQKMERITNNGEPIEDGAPIIYTDKKEGVIADYNIRTDRFERALEAKETLDKDAYAKRENVNLKIVKDDETKEVTKGESTHGTSGDQGSNK